MKNDSTPHRKVQSVWPSVEFRKPKIRGREVITRSRNSPYKTYFYKAENTVIFGGNQNNSNPY